MQWLAEEESVESANSTHQHLQPHSCHLVLYVMTLLEMCTCVFPYMVHVYLQCVTQVLVAEAERHH